MGAADSRTEHSRSADRAGRPARTGARLARARVLAELDAELVGLAPVKQRIREIAALLVVGARAPATRARRRRRRSLHMGFTGNPGTGKTTVALKMARILHRLGYVRKGHVVSVTRDDLVGQYIGHTAPKTREILKKAMGGVLFIDEAYYLYRPENERDYGQEAIEILLQVMENQRDDLVVILGRLPRPHGHVLPLQPGHELAHRAPHPLSRLHARRVAGHHRADGPRANYRFDDGARDALREYVAARVQQPHFANARSMRNAIDRARLRQANRLFDGAEHTDAIALQTLTAADIRASRVLAARRIDDNKPDEDPSPCTWAATH